MDESLNLVLFSGTDDKLQAAAVLTAGAAALGKPVNLFLQYWALDAFRADRIAADHGLSPEAGEAGRRAGPKRNRAREPRALSRRVVRERCAGEGSRVKSEGSKAKGEE